MIALLEAGEDTAVSVDQEDETQCYVSFTKLSWDDAGVDVVIRVGATQLPMRIAQFQFQSYGHAISTRITHPIDMAVHIICEDMQPTYLLMHSPKDLEEPLGVSDLGYLEIVLGNPLYTRLSRMLAVWPGCRYIPKAAWDDPFGRKSRTP